MCNAPVVPLALPIQMKVSGPYEPRPEVTHLFGTIEDLRALAEFKILNMFGITHTRTERNVPWCNV